MIESTDTCSKYKDCSSCTFDTSCGFCFETATVNTSCVLIDTTHMDYASYGRCSETQNVATFAPDYCPSNTAWLIVLGLVSYLFFFAPGNFKFPSEFSRPNRIIDLKVIY